MPARAWCWWSGGFADDSAVAVGEAAGDRMPGRGEWRLKRRRRGFERGGRDREKGSWRWIVERCRLRRGF